MYFVRIVLLSWLVLCHAEATTDHVWRKLSTLAEKSGRSGHPICRCFCKAKRWIARCFYGAKRGLPDLNDCAFGLEEER